MQEHGLDEQKRDPSLKTEQRKFKNSRWLIIMVGARLHTNAHLPADGWDKRVFLVRLAPARQMYTIDLYEGRVQSTDTCAEARSASHGRPRVALYDFPSQIRYLYMITIPTTTLFAKYMSATRNITAVIKAPGHLRNAYLWLVKGRPIPPAVRLRGLQTDEARQDERGELRRINGVFDGNPRAINPLPKKLAIMAKDEMRGSLPRLLLVVLHWAQSLFISNARLHCCFIQLGC